MPSTRKQMPANCMYLYRCVYRMMRPATKPNMQVAVLIVLSQNC